MAPTTAPMVYRRRLYYSIIIADKNVVKPKISSKNARRF
jgi:hypothetical protein